MAPAKPTTAWAVASVVCSSLGLLGAAPLPLIDYQHIVGATAGVGVVGPFLLGLLSAALGILGFVFGLVALARIGEGRFSGRGLAWAGIVLGGLLSLAYVVVVLWLSGWADAFGG
jgi:hypothetical protein